jgi:hypothetical protein
MRKWIIFRAEKRQPGWEDRKYAHTGSLTKTLFEHYDCSDRALPEIGYRPPEFIRVDQLAAPSDLESKTHYRQSDWEVVRVEAYTPEIPMGMGFDMIVICYCKHSPINASLQPMPERRVSIDSFSGDQAAYEQWLETQKQPAEV